MKKIECNNYNKNAVEKIKDNLIVLNFEIEYQKALNKAFEEDRYVANSYFLNKTILETKLQVLEIKKEIEILKLEIENLKSKRIDSQEWKPW